MIERQTEKGQVLSFLMLDLNFLRDLCLWSRIECSYPASCLSKDSKLTRCRSTLHDRNQQRILLDKVPKLCVTRFPVAALHCL